MKIEIGMYVRTDKGYIGRKILDNNANDTDTDTEFQVGNILKASNNIIDLIEEGDYVNGYLVDYVRADNNNKKWVYLGNNHTYNLCNEEIKSIVTHEQFESMKYKIEG